MSETWKQWEGRAIDGKFPLQSYLGGSDHSAVFLTDMQRGTGEHGKAAIKLLLRNASAENQAARWQAAREFDHPNLLRIYDAGRAKLDGAKLAYVVEEYAEENLSQILPERALTADEARGMLPPILAALQYVHGKGLVHGRIQPSNIFAVGDQVKLSSDGLKSPDDKNDSTKLASDYGPPEAATGKFSAASDIWYLGMTLIEVLTQHPPAWNRAGLNSPTIPAAVPEPFREIARQCLQVEASKRCTISEIGSLLEGNAPRSSTSPQTGSQPGMKAAVASVAAQTGSQSGSQRYSPNDPGARKISSATISKKWSFLLGVAAVLAIAIVVIPKPKPKSSSSTSIAATGAKSTAVQPSASAPGEDSQSAPASTPAADATGNSEAANADNQTDVVRRVMPDVSQGGRRSIHGKILVRVKVEVDPAGNVSKAKLDSGHASPYFKRLAMEAARDWKFAPAQSGDPSDREWKLQFAFTRAKTEASVVPVQR